MNLKRIILLCFLFAAVAHASQEADNAKKQAQQCADAQVAKDYATVASFTHPALVKAAGGKKALISAIQSSMKQVVENGIAFEKTVVGTVDEPRKVGKSLVSLVTQEVTLRTPDGKLKQESTLVAYSNDEGKKWVFADTAEMDEATFYRFFPELKGVISLPEKKEPVVLADAAGVTSPALPRQSNSADLEAAKSVFNRYVKLEREFDPSVADLYTDDAVIKNTRRLPDGTSRTMSLAAPAYKKLLKQAMPQAKERNDTSKYSEVGYKEEDTKVRITATRYSELKKYSSPLSLLIAKQGDNWLIVEELSESKP